MASKKAPSKKPSLAAQFKKADKKEDAMEAKTGKPGKMPAKFRAMDKADEAKEAKRKKGK